MGKEEITEIIQTVVQTALKDLGLEREVEKNDLMSTIEACEFLKMKPAAIYHKTHKNEIPFMKKGKLLYFSRLEITAWLNSGRNFTSSEREIMADKKLQDLKIRK
jgi:excisionase family DNA binding protein